MTEQNIKFGQIQNPYKEFTYTIPAGESETIYYAFNYWRILSLSGGTLQMRFGGSGELSNVSGSGLGQELDDPIPHVTIKNDHASQAMTVTIAMAIGRIDDDRLNVVGTGIETVSGSGNVIDTKAAFTAGVSALSAITASANTKRVWIYNNHASAVLYWGDSGVTIANGMPIPAGSFAILETADEIFLISDTASTNVRLATEGI